MSNQQMFLQLDRVKCMDETGGSFVERVGNDEIWLSGVAIDATGATVMLAPFEIYAHFDDGEEKRYSPPRTLFTLAVPDDGKFPKVCRATLILCERADGAGHLTVTQQYLTQMNALIAAAMAAGEDKPTDDDSFWGGVIDLVINFVKGVITSGISDNVFPPMKVTPVKVTSGNFFWGDGTKLSPEETLIFEGHQGKYYVTCYWQIETVA